jgi:hypothetical protein
MAVSKYIRSFSISLAASLVCFQVAALSPNGSSSSVSQPGGPGTNVVHTNVSRARTPELDQTYQRTMRRAQSAAAASKAVRGVLRTVSGLGLLLTVVELAGDIHAIIKPQPDGTIFFEKPDPDYCLAECYQYQAAAVTAAGDPRESDWFYSRQSACAALAPLLASNGYAFTNISTNLYRCDYSVRAPDGSLSSRVGDVRRRGAGPTPGVPMPQRVSDSDLDEQLKNWPGLPRLIEELDKKGHPIPFPEPDLEDLPKPIVLPPTVTKNPDGSTRTEQTTLIPSQEAPGGPVNWRREVVTSTTSAPGPDGSTTTTPQGTTTSSTGRPATADEPPPSECEKSPNTLGCAELDIPEGEIPRQNKDVSYSAEVLFGSANCPADKSYRSVVTGQAIVLSYQSTCDGLALYVKPIIIAIALYMAYLIILPGSQN